MSPLLVALLVVLVGWAGFYAGHYHGRRQALDEFNISLGGPE